MYIFFYAFIHYITGIILCHPVRGYSKFLWSRFRWQLGRVPTVAGGGGWGYSGESRVPGITVLITNVTLVLVNKGS